MSEILTLREAAELLHTSENTLRWWRQLGQGPQGYRVGRRVMFDKAEVERWLDAQRQASAADR